MFLSNSTHRSLSLTHKQTVSHPFTRLNQISGARKKKEKEENNKPSPVTPHQFYNHSISQSFIGKSKSTNRHVMRRCWCPPLTFFLKSHKLHVNHFFSGFYPFKRYCLFLFFLMGGAVTTTGLLVNLPMNNRITHRKHHRGSGRSLAPCI